MRQEQVTSNILSSCKRARCGEVAERSNAAVLKTADGQPSGGSNPSLSAKNRKADSMSVFLFFAMDRGEGFEATAVAGPEWNPSLLAGRQRPKCLRETLFQAAGRPIQVLDRRRNIIHEPLALISKRRVVAATIAVQGNRTIGIYGVTVAPNLPCLQSTRLSRSQEAPSK